MVSICDKMWQTGQ